MAEVFGILLLALKFTMCLILGTWLADRFLGTSKLLCLLAAWLFLQAFQLGGIFLLSAFSGLTPDAYRIWYALQGFFVFGYLSRKSDWKNFINLHYLAGNLSIVIAFLFLFLISLFLVIRGLFFYDCAYDSIVYGLPRLAYFFQSHSVFAFTPDMVSRIFCNEWNAELNALHYALLLRSDTGFMLAGVEVWWLAFIAITSLSKFLRTNFPQAIWVGLLIASTPAVVNLSGVMKGDILAMVAMLGALVFLLEATHSNRVYPGVAVAGLFLAFGAGSKGTLVPVFVFFCLCFGVWAIVGWRWKEVFPNDYAKVLIVLICALFLGRHIANFFVYGNPLQRVPLEAETRFVVENILPAIANQFQYLLGISTDKPWLLGFRFVETRDFAATGWLIILCIFICVIYAFRKKTFTVASKIFPRFSRIRTPTFFFLFGSVLAWILLCGMMPIVKYPEWKIFQFRFFLWFLVPTAILIFACALSFFKNSKWILILLFPVCASVILNLRFALQPSEVLSAPEGFKKTFQNLLYNSYNKKLVGPHFCARDLGSLNNLFGIKQKILLVMFSGSSNTYNGNLPIFPFFGKDLEWVVDFAATGAQFENKLKFGNYDWVVFSQDREAPLQENLDDELVGREYEWVHTGRWAQIYGKRDDQQ